MNLRFLLCFSLIFNLSLPAFAAPVPNVPPPGQIGVIGAVQGAVKIQSQGQVGRVVNSGEPVYLGDEVTTDGSSTLQILLLDETTFTIGPNSAIVIDKFIYDPATQDGEVKAKVVKGVFRFVTGKIAQKKPSQMEVELPAGTIGIRGTIVAGESQGNRSTVILLGPGENNNTPHRIGRFTLANGGEETTVSKSGFGSTIDGENGIPSEPFQIPAADLQRITQSLGPLPQDQGADPSQAGNGNPPQTGESVTEGSGQGKAGARETTGRLGRVGGVLNRLNRESQTFAQRQFNEEFKALDGPTSRNQLQAYALRVGGVGHYTITGKNFTSGTDTGTYSLDVDINFGNRNIGGGNSALKTVFNSNGNIDFAVPLRPFGFGDENAAFSYANLPQTGGGGCVAAVCTADILLGINNRNGEIAADANYLVSVNKTTEIGRDQGVFPRQPNLS